MRTTNYSKTLKLLKPGYLAIALSGLFLSSGPAVFAQNNPSEKIHIGLIYPLSSNGTHAPLDTNKFSFHLLAGVSSVEKGFSFAGLLNTSGENQGAAFAGFVNVSRGNVKGIQFAGFGNIAKNLNGAQFAGFLNKANTVKGSQLAGFLNIAEKNVSASQLAGFMNTAADVKGSQFAGFINIAKKVKGIQAAGFINIADSSDYPIGIINLVKKGEKSISLTMDETQTGMLAFRSGGKVTYGILGIGYNFKNKKQVYAMEAGIGAHWFQTAAFRLNTELSATVLESFKSGEYFKSTLRILPALKLGNHLELFAGPSINFLSTNTTEGKNLHKKFIHTWGDRSADFQALYIGYSGGIQFIF